VSKDYEELCTRIVVPHLHKLVKTIEADRLQKVLVHEWVLGIEKNWAEYSRATSHDSTFVARLTFWIHGLRDKFADCKDDRQAVILLNEVFEASTYGCLEYGGDPGMALQIERFCATVDAWMGRKVLQPRWATFSIISKTGPLINRLLETMATAQRGDLGVCVSWERELRRRLLENGAPEHDVVEGMSRLVVAVYNISDEFLASHPEYSETIFRSLDAILKTVEGASVGDRGVLETLRRKLATARMTSIIKIKCITWYGRVRPKLKLIVSDRKATEQHVTTDNDGTALLRVNDRHTVSIRTRQSGREIKIPLKALFTTVELRLLPFGFLWSRLRAAA
jgi:hypothetical protein